MRRVGRCGPALAMRAANAGLLMTATATIAVLACSLPWADRTLWVELSLQALPEHNRTRRAQGRRLVYDVLGNGEAQTATIVLSSTTEPGD